MYVTDHTPKDKKYFTLNNSEDEHFYRYKKSLEEYNQIREVKKEKPTSKYEKGSLLQKIFDPLGSCERLESGTLFYKLEDKELSPVL